jgi:hypothetical protein
MGRNQTILSPGMETYRFCFIAISRGYVTLNQVQKALAEQLEDYTARRPHRTLGEILLENYLITEEQIKSILWEMGRGDE